MAFEKLYNELYAAVALLALAPELAGDLEKGESPDWVEPVRDMGVEVTQALRQQDGEAQRFLERYLGRRAEEIPPAAAEALTADLRRIQQDAPRKFDRVFLDGVDCLYLGGLTQGGTERRAIPLAAAVRLREAAGFLRGVGEWQAGASVVKTLREVALLREE